MAKYFNIKDIRGRIEFNLPCNGKRYVVTAENENGDTFHKTTDDSEVFDYIDEDNEEFERKREDAEEWADDELWELEDILNNYDYIKETLVSAVEKFIKD